MTPHDSVRKAAEFIKLDYDDNGDWTEREIEQIADIIDSHCHVTEMEAVIEKVGRTLRVVQSEFSDVARNTGGMRPWSTSVIVSEECRRKVAEALSSIDALKGGGE